MVMEEWDNENSSGGMGKIDMVLVARIWKR